MISAGCFGQEKSNISAIREELFYTDFTIEKCHLFYNKLINLGEVTPVITAYEGAAKALIAKHTWNPILKITCLKESLDLLQSAIDLDNINVEIRFLRLYIENSIPSYLGIKNHMQDDKKAILNNIDLLKKSEFNADIIDYICQYIATNMSCTPEEIKILSSKFL